MCEVRSYMVEGEVAHTSYTRFLPPEEDGAFSTFQRCPDREVVVSNWLARRSRNRRTCRPPFMNYENKMRKNI